MIEEKIYICHRYAESFLYTRNYNPFLIELGLHITSPMRNSVLNKSCTNYSRDIRFKNVNVIRLIFTTGNNVLNNLIDSS